MSSLSAAKTSQSRPVASSCQRAGRRRRAMTGAPEGRRPPRLGRRTLIPAEALSFAGGVDRISRSLPDPRGHHLPDQSLARGDASRRPGSASPSTRGSGGRAGSAPGARAGGRCRSRSATRSAGSSAPTRDDRHAPERRGRGGGRPLLLPAGRPARVTGSSTRPRTSHRCAISTRPSPSSKSSSARRRGDHRGDRRADAARADLARALQSAELQDVAAIIAARSRGRGAGRSRLLPVGRDCPVRRRRARRRLRGRRIGQMALRRARGTAGSTSGPI